MSAIHFPGHTITISHGLDGFADYKCTRDYDKGLVTCGVIRPCDYPNAREWKEALIRICLAAIKKAAYL